MDIIRQSACMAVNPIVVDNIASGGRLILTKWRIPPESVSDG